MARQHELSCDCTKSELDLFSIPPTQTSIEGGQWIDTHPTATLDDGSPIEFVIPGEGNQYIDLSNIQLYIQARILRGDGGYLGAQDYPGPVNNWLHSMFEQVEVTLGDTIISSATHTYPYRAYIENLTSLSRNTKETQMGTCLWFKDDYRNMDSATCQVLDGQGKPVPNTNSGLQSRGALTRRSHVVEMVGRLHSDMFSQDRLLLNKVKLRIKLIRSRNPFCLMSTMAAGPKVHIDKAVLYVRKVDISDNVFNAHQQALIRGPAKYPIKRVICKYFQIPRGSTSTNQENLFSGQMPTRIIIGCVDSDAFNGAYGKNPFNFKNKHISEVGLYLAGVKEPIKTMHPIFPNQSLLSYLSFLTGTGKWGKDEDCGFDRFEHADGYTLFAWDLTPDLSTGDHFQLKKNTGVRMELKFSHPLADPTNVVVYAEFENMVMIDADRNVSTNFQV